MALAVSCGMCSDTIPAPACSVNGQIPPKEVCYIPNAANKRMYLFASKYSPMNILESSNNKEIRTQEEADFEGEIQDSETALASAYPSTSPSNFRITWPDVELCLQNKSGEKGLDGNRYFNRKSALDMGMSPQYPLGKSTAENAIWKKKPSPLPLTIDYLMNPDLFVIVMFALVVLIFAVILSVSWYKSKKAADLVKQQQEKELEKKLAAPYPKTPEGIKEKCKEYVEAMEQRGYDMSYYKSYCGL